MSPFSVLIYPRCIQVWILLVGSRVQRSLPYQVTRTFHITCRPKFDERRSTELLQLFWSVFQIFSLNFPQFEQECQCFTILKLGFRFKDFVTDWKIKTLYPLGQPQPTIVRHTNVNSHSPCSMLHLIAMWRKLPMRAMALDTKWFVGLISVYFKNFHDTQTQGITLTMIFTLRPSLPTNLPVAYSAPNPRIWAS